MSVPAIHTIIEANPTAVPKYCKHDMQFYNEFATGLMDFRELERLAIERLSILGVVLKIATNNELKRPEECRKKLILELKKRGFERFAAICDGQGCEVDTKERRDARKMDNIMHNILCLVFHRETEAQKWLREMETYLFRWRLEALNEQGIVAFKAINNIQFPAVHDTEKECLKSELIRSTYDEPFDGTSFDKTTFYKVPFEMVCDLVQDRLVYLEKGQAYITKMEFRFVIYEMFKRYFASKLNKSIGPGYQTDGDERIHILGKRLEKMYEKAFRPIASRSGRIPIEKLDELVETSYPPCMRNLHKALQQNHHLRNGGRLQYTLFLKEIGLSVEGAVKLYRNEFTKKFSHEEFDKEYRYQFRHMYGIVGARKNYKLPECIRIAEEPMGSHDNHGCIFATHDIEDLGKRLTHWEIPRNYTEIITRSAANKEYGKACSTYFKALHGCTMSGPIVKPTDFYNQSVKIRNEQIDDEDYESEDGEAKYC